jgi:hypothetical protein
MSSYLREMNSQVWWMVDVVISQALEDCPQTEAQKNCLYLKVHASNVLFSAMSVEIKDEIEIEYGLLKEQIFFGSCLSKCLSQAMIRDHLQQKYQRISHPHLHIFIKIKKSSQVFKKKK